MNFNAEMFSILLAISGGTWLLVNRVFLKSGVKIFIGVIYKRYLSNIKADFKGESLPLSLEKVTRLSVSIAVLFVSIGLVALSQSTSMYTVIEGVGEFEYAGGLIDATFIKCFLDVNPGEWSLLWYVDIILTIAFIYSGSKVMHRIEQYFGFKYDTAKKANSQ